jgi:hypothetical protein
VDSDPHFIDADLDRITAPPAAAFGSPFLGERSVFTVFSISAM